MKALLMSLALAGFCVTGCAERTETYEPDDVQDDSREAGREFGQEAGEIGRELEEFGEDAARETREFGEGVQEGLNEPDTDDADRDDNVDPDSNVEN